MKSLPRAIIIASALLFLTSCSGCLPTNSQSSNSEGDVQTITQITIAASSGPISSELQWHEEYIITSGQITFRRSGSQANSTVNQGNWQVDISPGIIQALFSELLKVDCSGIQRIEPEEVPDGGGTVSYSVEYASQGACNLLFDPGTTYQNGVLMTQPIQAFLDELLLPSEAVNRYEE